MFGLFRKKEIDPDRHMFERWETKFGLLQKRRFEDESGRGYAAFRKNKTYRLELHRKNMFAWVVNNYFKYSDFVLTADTVFDPDNGHSSIGIIFRYINNENFYSFFIARNGTFRFDVLFNGNPIHLIEWTESPFIKPSDNEIMIVARGSNFSFYTDNEWLAEYEDDTLNMGKFGLAAQNYNQKARAEFMVRSLAIDSRSLEVEKAYYRWNNYIPAQPEQRITYAKTLFSGGNFQAAAVQFKKAFKQKTPTADESFFLAECLLNLELYQDALTELEACLAKDPAHGQARLEKANLLYLLNNFIGARDYIRTIIDEFPQNAVLHNVLGNCEYSLGNFAAAYKSYRRAIELDKDTPQYYVNAARSAEKTGEKDTAKDGVLELYLKAARLFFVSESYLDLSLIVPRITALDADNREVKSIQAKVLFHEGKTGEARRIFLELAQNGYRDSAVFFLLGLILIAEDNREGALSYLRQATEMEPGFALYWFRLAETEYLLGLDPLPALKKAYDLDQDDVWINNLYGLVYGRKNELARAEDFLQKAYAGAPLEKDIIINLSDVLFRRGNTQEAFELVEKGLTDRGNDPSLLNHRANMLAEQKRFTEAAEQYEKALALEPENPVYMENCAAASIESDRIMRADELLVKLVDLAPSASVYNKLGNVALIRGEYKRAELCYNEGLALEPDNPEIKTNLASVYGDRLEYEKAKRLLLEVLDVDKNARRAKKLFQALRGRFEKQLHCASCKRTWWAPKDLPVQEALKIFGEPPHDSPAGKCNQCGKIYCIGCASEHVRQKRFVCPDCGEFLKLSDDHLRYLVVQYVNNVNNLK
jgi:tetratricopeptide (TPR) repeat protein